MTTWASSPLALTAAVARLSTSRGASPRVAVPDTGLRTTVTAEPTEDAVTPTILRSDDFGSIQRAKEGARIGRMGGARLCVLCREHPVEDRWKPFCSQRCRDEDLARWADGRYRIAAEPLTTPDEDDDLSAR